MEERIIYLSFAPWESLPAELKKLGLKCELQEHGETLLIRNESFGTGLTRSTDPINKAAVIAWALCGPEWMRLFPYLLRKVDAQWKKFAYRRKNDS